MPSLDCIGSSINQGERCECIPACSDDGCTAPIPRASNLLATEDMLDLLCQKPWTGRKPDCIVLSQTMLGLAIVIVELKHARKLKQHEVNSLGTIILDKVRDSLNNLKDCIKTGFNVIGLNVYVAMPFYEMPEQVSRRLRNMLARSLKEFAGPQPLTGQPCLVLYDCSGHTYFSTC